MLVPVVSTEGVFALLRRQLAGRCEPGPEICPNPAKSGSARPLSEILLKAGPFDAGLQVNNRIGLTEWHLDIFTI